MITIRLIVQLHYGHELEAIVMWPAPNLPGPREVTAEMEELGDLEAWRFGADGLAPARIYWDPREASSVVVELSSITPPQHLAEAVSCSFCGAHGVMGLECGECGSMVTGEALVPPGAEDQ